MKILKIIGAVAAVHLAVFMFIFAIPGCRSTAKPTPASTATEAAGPSYGDTYGDAPPPASPAGLDQRDLNPALASSSDSVAYPGGSRHSPTRPSNVPSVIPLPEDFGPAVQPTPVEGVQPATTYVVVKNDSLWTIAKKHGVSVRELEAANSLKNASILRVGQKLIIPTASAAAAKATETPAPATPARTASRVTTPTAQPAAGAVKHVVKPGETLGGIAKKYQVTVGALATANAIADPAKIPAGKELTIPGATIPKSELAPKPATPPPPPTTPTVPAQEPPLFTPVPAPDQDLDTGLTPQSNVPVVPIEEAPASAAPRIL